MLWVWVLAWLGCFVLGAPPWLLGVLWAALIYAATRKGSPRSLGRGHSRDILFPTSRDFPSDADSESVRQSKLHKLRSRDIRAESFEDYAEQQRRLHELPDLKQYYGLATVPDRYYG
jgi:hypothetical protein